MLHEQEPHLFQTPERIAVELAKQQLLNATHLLKTAQEQITEAQASYRDSVLAVLGGSRASLLSPYAEEILVFADQERVDPKWFFSEISATAEQIQQNSEFEYEKAIENPLTAEEHFNQAIHYINKGKYEDDIYTRPAKKEFGLAAQIAADQEKEKVIDPKRRISVAYLWLASNASILSRLHALHYWAHY